jgi:hypothetical protein
MAGEPGEAGAIRGEWKTLEGMEDAFEGLLEVEGRLAVVIPLIVVLIPRGWF